jgi:hypothetical protein
MQEDAKKIVLKSSLKGHFFECLNELNQRSLCPVPESIIYYSSEVLDKFSLSTDYFEVSEGKVKHKVLGTKLLEATQLSREEQKLVYKEVGDMSLMVCGYFSESINKKIIDIHYYCQLGKMAYGHLNNVVPTFLDIPSFYSMVATSFESMTNLMSILASSTKGRDQNLFFQKVMKNEPLTERELLSASIILPGTDKAS